MITTHVLSCPSCKANKELREREKGVGMKARVHFNAKKDLGEASPLCGEYNKSIGDSLTRSRKEMTCGMCMIRYRAVRERVLRERHRIHRTTGGMGT